MTIILSYLILGGITGIIAGLFGVGGGLIIVPVLSWLFLQQGIAAPVIMHLAIGTSLATILLTGLSSVRAHHRHGAVLWPITWQLTPGIILGVIIGAQVVHLLDTHTLKIIFGVFELIVALKIFWGVRPNPQRQLPGRIMMFGVGNVIGFVSGIIGIGGGVLTVPFLVWCKVSIRNAVATSAACGVPIALAGSLGFAIVGWSGADLPAYTTGYIYWPAFLGVAMASMISAPFGAHLTHTLSLTFLNRLLALLLASLGVRMLFFS